MKRIAIFVTGAGEAAERVVKLFNEGNRVKTVLVVVDDSATELVERLKGEDVIVMHIPDSEWPERTETLAALLKENEVKLIVEDGFAHEIPEELAETVDGEIIRVSGPELAPKEVVAALEADLRRPAEQKPEQKPTETEPTLESEWANALKIQYVPPTVPMTPPEVPKMEEPRSREEPRFREESNKNREPMPSTWLIWSILVTVFCCFIPGIVAIIFSSQVTSRYFAGDIEGAKRSSRNAEIWIIISVVAGVIAATLYLPFMLLG